MKRNFKVLGFAAMMTIAAFTITSCGGSTDNAPETEAEVITEELEVENEAQAVVDQEGVEVIEVEVDSVEVEGEGKCGEGKCGEGKCG